MATYTIGKLASAMGVPTSTVRYYERIGLIRPAGRRGAGQYRTYSSEELERLAFIRAAQVAGFALEDIAMLLSLRDGATTPCKKVQILIEQRLTDLAQRLRDLRRVDAVLKASLKLCRQMERTGRCEVIDTLSVASRAATSRSSR
jgi:MerR family mercuric resistance operon transcriptional regulator